jgi:putative transposase
VKEYHRQWVEEILKNGSNRRDAKWSESIAVGDKEFVAEAKSKLGARAIGRKILEVADNGDYELREMQFPYNPLFAPEKSSLSLENSYFWDVFS